MTDIIETMKKNWRGDVPFDMVFGRLNEDVSPEDKDTFYKHFREINSHLIDDLKQYLRSFDHALFKGISEKEDGMADTLEKLDRAAKGDDLHQQAADEIRQLRTSVALLMELVKDET